MKHQAGGIQHDVAQMLREARHAAGLTQRQLAARAHTSAAAVTRYERGRVLPDLRTLRRLLEACGRDLRLIAPPLLDHDDALIEASLALTPVQRVLRNERGAAVMSAAAEARRQGRVRPL